MMAIKYLKNIFEILQAFAIIIAFIIILIIKNISDIIQFLILVSVEVLRGGL